jgi:hypothetical protein
MRKLLTFLIALASIAFGVCSPASADSCSRAFGYQGIGTGCNSVIASGGGGFVGPGDAITPQAVAYYGFRAYNAAYAAPGTNPAMQLCDKASGVTCVTINILTSGFADRATALASSACATQCGVSSLTDQTGHGNTASNGNRLLWPVVLFSGCPGAFQMCAQFVPSPQASELATANITQAQPFTFVAVAKRTGNFTSFGSVIDFGTGTATMGFSSTANAAWMTAGSANRSITGVTDSVLHSMIGVFNGASSEFTADATSSAVASPGTQGAAAAPMKVGDDGNGDVPTNTSYEWGLYGSALSNTDAVSLSNNMHGASGWNF